MLSLFRRQRKVARPRFVRPVLEALESRDNPAAPTISNFTATIQSGRSVQVTGTVTDENPMMVSVSFGGVLSGMIMPDAQGNFSYTGMATGLGTITAVGTDNEMLTSNTAQATISSSAPTLSNLAISYGATKSVTVTGHVNDESSMGLTVTLGGVAGMAMAMVDLNGNFSTTTTPSALGNITVTATDVWGLSSGASNVAVTNSAPSISNFVAIEGPQRIWTFKGQVTDEYAIGLTVELGGIDSLDNQMTPVESNGWFTFVVTLGVNEEGTAWAKVKDWWNVYSETVYDIVDQT
jgi:hypothetical protein